MSANKRKEGPCASGDDDDESSPVKHPRSIETNNREMEDDAASPLNIVEAAPKDATTTATEAASSVAAASVEVSPVPQPSMDDDVLLGLVPKLQETSVLYEVLSPPHKHPHLQNAEIRWRHYVYKTTQDTLSKIGSDYFDIYLDKVAAGELDGNPLVIDVGDQHIHSPEEMYSFLRFILGPVRTSFAHIEVLDGGSLDGGSLDGGGGKPRTQNIFNSHRGQPACPIAFVERLCQLGGYFGLDAKKHHNFLMALQTRAPKECPATTVVEWGRNFSDPILMRRGMRSLIVAVEKKEVHLNDISSPTIQKLLPVMRSINFQHSSQSVLNHNEFHSIEREALSLMIKVHEFDMQEEGIDILKYAETSDEDEDS